MYSMTHGWLFQNQYPLSKYAFLFAQYTFFIEIKQTNWELDVPDLHHEKPLRDSYREGVKLRCDDLDKKGTEELKRDIIMCTLHLQRAHISLVTFLWNQGKHMY